MYCTQLNFLLYQYAKVMTKIFNDSNFKRKEKLVVMLMSQDSDFVVGKTISLQLITLVCVSTEN